MEAWWPLLVIEAVVEEEFMLLEPTAFDDDDAVEVVEELWKGLLLPKSVLPKLRCSELFAVVIGLLLISLLPWLLLLLATECVLSLYDEYADEVSDDLMAVAEAKLSNRRLPDDTSDEVTFEAVAADDVDIDEDDETLDAGLLLNCLDGEDTLWLLLMLFLLISLEWFKELPEEFALFLLMAPVLVFVGVVSW